ncbi:MAG: hypothetical protein AAF281_11330, partial [Pseudomonadota bacterium]
MRPTRRAPLPGEVTLPLKDALRGVRFALRTGRRQLDPLAGRVPIPLAGLAADVMGQVDQVAAGVEAFGSTTAHRFLDAPGAADGAPDLPQPDAGSGSAQRFAQTVYYGLSRALSRLGTEDALVSETLAAEAFRSVRDRTEPALVVEDYAAEIMRALLDRVVAGRPPGLTPAVPEDQGAIAVFAVTLWLLVERAGGAEDEDQLLDTCTDVARAQ